MSEIGAFVQLPYSHSGKRLGHALYRAFLRVQAEKKVSYLHDITNCYLIHYLFFTDWLDCVR